MKGTGVRDSRQDTGDEIADRRTGNRRLQGSWGWGTAEKTRETQERIRNGSGTGKVLCLEASV